MSADPRATWHNPRILLTLGLIFVCGALTGALIMTLGARRPVRASSLYWQEGGKDISIQRFQKELNLTPQQTQELEAVLDDFVMYIQMLQAQMDEVRANGKERIVRILNEEQKQKFEKMLLDVQAKRSR